MQDAKSRKLLLNKAETDIDSLLSGKTPRLIDEWQTAPELWDAVRATVDKRNAPGQFILTGSSSPDGDNILHTGTGRFSRLRMRPMSLYESMDSNGGVSLGKLFSGEFESCVESDITIDDLAYLIARGGWPYSVGKDADVAMQVAKDYLDSVVNADISEVGGARRDPRKVLNVIRSLSRNICTTASTSTIARDTLGDDEASKKTVETYLGILERMFITDDVPAWDPRIRSRTRIRSSPKRNLADPSIAMAALKVSPEGLLNDFRTMGFMFESLCLRDLHVYTEALGGVVYHYRDETDLEVDAIIDLGGKEWGAVEIKLGGDEADRGAKNLMRLKNKIDEARENPPAFLMVLTGTGFAHIRDDGVYVVPVGCLKD